MKSEDTTSIPTVTSTAPEAQQVDELAADALQRIELKEKSEGATGEECAPTSPSTDAEETATAEPEDHNKDDEEEEVEEENDDDDDDDNDEDEDVAMTTDAANEKLLQAQQLKEEGNTHFQQGQLEAAARSYRRGCQALKNLNKNNTGDIQVQALLGTLHTNLSMVCFKQSKYQMSVTVASRALALDPANVKALYRRAVAQRQLGGLEEARNDLKEAVRLDPKNAACVKELLAVRKELEQTKENQKKALAKAFSKSSSSFLYTDKEAEEKRKQELAVEKKKQEQELYKKRKVQWEDECVKRMANNEPAISFEDWEKERKAEEVAKKKREEKQRKEERKKAREAKRAASKSSSSSHDDDEDDDDELTEKELAMMRGYKKTSDGRITSYFTRELSEEAKNALGDIAPKRLDENGNTAAADRAPPAASANAATPVATSVWNQAGTWEEKDTTSWCTSQLRKRLEETSITGNTLDIDIVEISELTGDASVAMTGGKKRYIFDFHAKLKYQVKSPDRTEAVAEGEVRLPDICSTSHHELEVDFESAWKKAPAFEYATNAVNMRNELAKELRESVKRWVQDFNNMY